MHQIPQNFGKSKIKLLRGEELHESRQKHHKDTDMSFSIGDDFTPALLPRAGFNVLYVETPRIGLLQTPEFQLLAETWQETVELVKPLLRFGFPETSLRTKCPYYNEDLHATPSGSVLANDNLRKLVAGIEHGCQGGGSGQHDHQQQQQQHLQQHGPPIRLQQSSSSSSSSAQQQADSLSFSSSSTNSSSSSGPLGIGSTLSFLAGLLKEQQQQQQKHGHGHSHSSSSSAIPKSNLLVPELPSGSLVLGLNLLAYWAISRQARRGFGA